MQGMLYYNSLVGTNKLSVTHRLMALLLAGGMRV